jgi:hypothetical protein
VEASAIVVAHVGRQKAKEKVPNAKENRADRDDSRALEASTKQQAARLMGISPRALSYYLANYPSIAQNRGRKHAAATSIDPAAFHLTPLSPGSAG